MIRRLQVRDFVRLREIEISLSPGFNVLTGGSGEGKSLLLSALGFGLGQGAGGRDASVRWIRPGASEVSVEIEVDLSWGNNRSRLSAAGLPDESLVGDRLTLSRSLDSKGRSRARAGLRAIPLTTLRQAGLALAERFSQGQAQRLLDPDTQRGLLDRFASLEPTVADYAQLRAHALDSARARDELARQERAGLQEQASLADERVALAELAPRPDEFEALLEEQVVLEAAQAEQHDARAALAALDDGDAPLEALRRVLLRLERLQQPALAEARRVLSDGIGLLDEGAGLLAAQLERVEFDPGRLVRVGERRADYQRLARRLGMPPAALAVRWADLDPSRLEALTQQRLVLEGELRRAAARLEPLAAELGQARTDSAQDLEQSLRQSLSELGLPRARVTISVTPSGATPPESAPGCWLEEGTDAEAWLIACHPSPSGPQNVAIEFGADSHTPPGPLSRASGGELSRLFLALGQRVASQGDAPLLVVDEVDQNVGARLGAAVGRCLQDHAQGRQVLAVTHLAPVAASAARHLRILRDPAGELRTEVLEGPARVEELALMLAGQASPSARQQASELLSERVALPRARPAVRKRSKRTARPKRRKVPAAP